MDISNLLKTPTTVFHLAGTAALCGVVWLLVRADRWLHAAYDTTPGPGAHLEYATRLTHALGQSMMVQACDMAQNERVKADLAADELKERRGR